jgi:hypothetical protein
MGGCGAHNAAMSNCLFTTPLGMPALIGLFIGMAVGWALKYGTALRNPANPEVDKTMGRAIYAVCMVVGSLVGVIVQIYVTGECGRGSTL